MDDIRKREESSSVYNENTDDVKVEEVPALNEYYENSEEQNEE